ncbi:MAG: MOSC domain-containing protein, partial [Actinobacteria bacterium]
AFPLMVMTEAALTSLASALPDSEIDVRRFRPSIVIDSGSGSGSAPGHPESEWTGRSARIGSAVVEFNAQCPRCIMVTREVDESLPSDRAVLRHIVRDLDQNVGVYATITTPGTIRVGDAFEFL